MLVIITTILYLVNICVCYRAVPALLASHKLISGLQSHVLEPKPTPYPIDDAIGLTKRLITPCTSDIYLILNQPGLLLSDFEKYDNWLQLRRYLTLSSTIVELPGVREAIDLDHIERYIIKNCAAETIRVTNNDESEVPHYIDVRKRIIRVDLKPLDEKMGPNQRESVIRENDSLIRLILRKVPSPDYTIILTSDHVYNYHPIPDFLIETNPEMFHIFPDIVYEESRKVEFERNNKINTEDRPIWNAPRGGKYDRAFEKKKEVHFFDRELWVENEKMIVTMVVMVIGIFFVQVMRVLRRVVRWVVVR